MNPVVISGVIVFAIGFSDATLVAYNVTLQGPSGHQMMLTVPVAAAGGLVVGQTLTVTRSSP